MLSNVSRDCCTGFLHTRVESNRLLVRIAVGISFTAFRGRPSPVANAIADEIVATAPVARCQVGSPCTPLHRVTAALRSLPSLLQPPDDSRFCCAADPLTGAKRVPTW